jgi:hypothetical protein
MVHVTLAASALAVLSLVGAQDISRISPKNGPYKEVWLQFFFNTDTATYDG